MFVHQSVRTTTGFARGTCDNLPETLECRRHLSGDVAAGKDSPRPPDHHEVSGVLIYVRSSAWGSAFKTHLQDQLLGDDVYGYRVDNKPETDLVPWTGVDEIVLLYRFLPQGNGVPSMANISVDGARTDYAFTSVTALDEFAYVLRLNRPMGNMQAGGENGDRVTFTAPGRPADGPFTDEIRVLQGDVDKSGSVLANDFSGVKIRFFRSITNPGSGPTGYDAAYDVNGDGTILANDFSAVKGRFFDNLPPAALAASATAPAAFSATRITDDLLA